MKGLDADAHVCRRAIALFWTLKPDYFEGVSLTALANRLGLHKAILIAQAAEAGPRLEFRQGRIQTTQTPRRGALAEAAMSQLKARLFLSKPQLASTEEKGRTTVAYVRNWASVLELTLGKIKDPLEYSDTLVVDGGMLKFSFTLLTPQIENKELPDPPYILIRWIEAHPRGNRLLKRHAGEMIDRIREKLGCERTIIFEPANGEMGNDTAQEKIEAYYLSCGFDYLASSTSRWWMTWRPNRDAEKD